MFATEQLHQQNPVVQKIKIERVTTADAKERLRVLAHEDIEPGHLTLLPLIRDSSCITDKSNNPRKVVVELLGSTLFLLPSIDAKQGGKNHFIPPFWAVKRSPRLQDANTTLTTVKFSVKSTCVLAGQRVGKDAAVDVPGSACLP